MLRQLIVKWEVTGATSADGKPKLLLKELWFGQ
jgi:hypothetical protein